jgi:hypothetical protein
MATLKLNVKWHNGIHNTVEEVIFISSIQSTVTSDVREKVRTTINRREDASIILNECELLEIM